MIFAKPRGFRGVLAVLVFVLPSPALFAKDYQGESLVGLGPVWVSYIHTFGEHSPVSGVRLRKDVIERLQMAGIEIVSDRVYFSYQGVPEFRVDLNIREDIEGKNWIVSVRVELSQDVLLAKNRTVTVSGVTWRSELLFNAVPVTGPNYIEQATLGLVDEFTRSYQAANGKSQ